jgi:enamine deaminase RidA (YjgF/YER057c/UK114 family)
MSKQGIRLSDIHNPFPGYPHAVKAQGLVFTSGMRPQLARGAVSSFEDLPPEGQAKKQGFALADHDEGAVSAHSWSVHENLEKVLEAAGTSGTQILRQHIWQRDKRYFPCFEQVRKVWQPAPSPSSGLGVKQIAGPGSYWIGIDAIAAVPGESKLFEERLVTRAVDNKDLPSASHYSQAVRSGPFVFTAGHIPINTSLAGKPLVTSFDDVPEDGRFLATGRSHPDSRDGPIAVQAWYVYSQLRETLEQQGLDLSNAVHATVYLADLRDLAVFHRVHQHFFPRNPPSICVTGFDEVGHRNCRIEIELTAIDPSADIASSMIDWPGIAPLAGAAARIVGPLIFYSGITGVGTRGHIVRDADEFTGEAASLVRNVAQIERVAGLAAQCWQSFETLRDLAARAGSSLEELAKMTVYVADRRDLETFEAIRPVFIGDENLPALEAVVVHGPGPVRDLHVQIEAIGLTD